MKILIADDDPQIIRALRITLGAAGYEVITAADGAAALATAISQHPDVVMLDLGMPRLDGVEVVQALRGWSQVPILVVSGRTGAGDKVDALDAGADDYVTKPFAMDELLARIRALTRRSTPAAGVAGASAAGSVATAVVSLGDVIVDLSAHSATGPTGPIRLTPTEWKLLELLLANPGRLVTREAMLTQVWGATHARDTGYLRLYLAQLRKKLEPVPSAPRYLVTEQGMGYRFVPDA